MRAQDRQALAAGLPPDLLLILITARRLWWETNGGEGGHDPAALSWPLPSGWWLSDELRAAVEHPAAADWDAIFVAAMRRALG